jgi:hypothetical protein
MVRLDPVKITSAAFKLVNAAGSSPNQNASCS